MSVKKYRKSRTLYAHAKKLYQLIDKKPIDIQTQRSPCRATPLKKSTPMSHHNKHRAYCANKIRSPFKSPATKKARFLSPVVRIKSPSRYCGLTSPLSDKKTFHKTKRTLSYNENLQSTSLLETNMNDFYDDETILYCESDENDNYSIDANSASKTNHCTDEDAKVLSDAIERLHENSLNGELMANDSIDANSACKTNRCSDEDAKVLSDAIERLRENNLNSELMTFLKLVSKGEFPVDNVAFLLFIDLVKWFSRDDARKMRYNDTTMRFFWLGKKLFGSRFIRFMSGPKNETDLLTGNFTLSPMNSRINFACPSDSVLRSYNPLGYEINVDSGPGVIQEMIDLSSEKNDEDLSYVLMFDGKKIKRGADMDLLGFEKEPLKERKAKFDIDCGVIEETIKSVKQISYLIENGQDVDKSSEAHLYELLIKCFKTISCYVMELRKLKKSKEAALRNYKEKIRKDPSLGKTLEYAMDSCRTSIFQIDNCVTQFMDVQLEICKTGAFLNGVIHLFASPPLQNTVRFPLTIDIDTQQNVKLLKPVEEMKVQLETNDLPTRYVKQRSDEWFKARQEVKVTGSTMYAAVGCETLKSQNNHIDKLQSNSEIQKPSEDQEKRMKHGTESEVHEIATLAGMIMPFLFPDMTYHEEGYYVEDEVIVSPDGSLRDATGSKCFYAMEGKAPLGNEFVIKQHYNVPERYITQCLFEQKVLKAEMGTMYICWTEESTTAFIVPCSDTLCEACQSIIRTIYIGQEPKRMSRLSKESKELKEGLKHHCSQCQYLGEFPSVKSQQRNDNRQDEIEEEFSYSDLARALLKAKTSIKESYNLKRIYASQVVVYLLSDLDRMWKSELPHAVPVMFFYRGYSLPMEIAKTLTEHCRNKCKAKGLDIVATASDGEFLPLMVKDKNQQPLTMHQLNKVVWSEVCKLKKSELVKLLRSLNTKYVQTTNENGRIALQSVDGGPRVKTQAEGWLNKGKRKSTQKPNKDGHLTRIEGDMNEESAGSTDGSELAIVNHIEHGEENVDSIKETESLDFIGYEQIAYVTDDVDPSLDNTLPYDYEELLEDSLENEGNQGLLIKEHDVKEILRQFCVKNPTKWNGQTSKQLKQMMKISLHKLLKDELIVIANYFDVKVTQNEHTVNLNKVKKDELVKSLSEVLGVEFSAPKRQIKLKQPKSLKDQVGCYLMKSTYPKQALNIAYASYVWPDRLSEWRKRNRVAERIAIKGEEEELVFEPYYVPEYIETEQDFNVFVYDKTHLGTNLRKCICLDKVKGISVKAWRSVSISDPDILHPTLIEVSPEGKIMDQMKETLARTLVSVEVETKMRSHGYEKEGQFCRIIREGLYIADDTPGISAFERCRKRIALIEWLNTDVDFGSFPPYGGSIKGLSNILYEGLRTSQEAKLYLYALAKSGTYCVRAPNTLCSESFFGSMQDMDPWGQGILSASGVQKHMSDFVTITAMKMEDKRYYGFYFNLNNNYSDQPVHLQSLSCIFSVSYLDILFNTR